MRKSFLVLLAVVLAIAGCGLGEKTGEVYIELEFNGARSILPPGDLVVTEYVVTGAGPGGATYSDTLTGNTVVGGLFPGEWTFTAVGRNAAHAALAEGTTIIEVVIGAAVTCHIDVNELTSPDGAFSLGLSWEPDIVLDPVWTGSLKNFAAVVTPLAFTVDELACTAATGVDPLGVGWYTMLVQLWDQPGAEETRVLSSGAATAVRIAAGQETHGDLELHAVQGYGTLDIIFDLNMNDPLVLTPNVPFGPVTFYQGGSQTFSVTADETCTAVFYLRGQQCGIDSFYLDASTLTPDEAYRLDVVCFNVDGSRAASDTWVVTYYDIDPETMDMHGTLNVGTWSIGEVHTFAIIDATTHAVVQSALVTPTAEGTRPWSIGIVPAGSYHLRYQLPDNAAWDGQVYFWTAGGAIVTDPALADVIVVPHAAGATYNFPTQMPH